MKRVLLLLFLAGLTVGAQNIPTTLQAEVQAENTQIAELWTSKKYEEGLKVLTARSESKSFLQLEPATRAGVHYNMACAAALLGRSGEALAYLGAQAGAPRRQSTNPEPKNALNLLEVCSTEKRGINCRMMATLDALAFPARLTKGVGGTIVHDPAAFWARP